MKVTVECAKRWLTSSSHLLPRGMPISAITVCSLPLSIAVDSILWPCKLARAILASSSLRRAAQRAGELCAAASVRGTSASGPSVLQLPLSRYKERYMAIFS